MLLQATCSTQPTHMPTAIQTSMRLKLGQYGNAGISAWESSRLQCKTLESLDTLRETQSGHPPGLLHAPPPLL